MELKAAVLEGLQEAILDTEIELPQDKVEKDKAADGEWKCLQQQVQEL